METNQYKVYGISRVKFFDIVAKFPFIESHIAHAGAVYIDAYLTEDEAKQINLEFPGAAWEVK